MICRHPSLHSGTNTSEHTKKCTEDRYPGVSLKRRAHKSEQTGAPRHLHIMDNIMGHMSASQKKIRTRGCHVAMAGQKTRNPKTEPEKLEPDLTRNTN